MPVARDPVQTQRRILRAARNEFMRHGYSGARVERISRAARSSDRMIYYYFASKEALYLQVLEGVYSELGEAESALVLDPTHPLEALDALIDFTWRYYIEHPEFVALLSNENLMRGLHITKSVRVKQLSRPVLGVLGTILAEGARQKVFRRDLLNSITIEEDGFAFEPEIVAKVARTGARIYEVGVSYAGRTYEQGKKISWHDGLSAIVAIVKYNVFRP